MRKTAFEAAGQTVVQDVTVEVRKVYMVLLLMGKLGYKAISDVHKNEVESSKEKDDGSGGVQQSFLHK